MKIIASIFFVLFALSIVGTAVFPSSVMALCNGNAMCEMIIHQIDKALALFNGVFSASFYLLLILINLSSVLFLLSVNKPVHLLKSEFSDCPNSIYLDYLKKLFSQGILEPQLYI